MTSLLHSYYPINMLLTHATEPSPPSAKMALWKYLVFKWVSFVSLYIGSFLQPYWVILHTGYVDACVRFTEHTCPMMSDHKPWTPTQYAWNSDDCGFVSGKVVWSLSGHSGLSVTHSGCHLPTKICKGWQYWHIPQQTIFINTIVLPLPLIVIWCSPIQSLRTLMMFTYWLAFRHLINSIVHWDEYIKVYLLCVTMSDQGILFHGVIVWSENLVNSDVYTCTFP